MFRVIGQVLNGCIAFIVIASAWFQCDLMSGKARFHIHHIAFADVELLRDLADLLWLERFQPFFMLRRLKNSLRCDLVVAILTSRQLRTTNSWISARIQCSAKETRRTPRSGS